MLSFRHWSLHLFSLELRKIFSYRVDFWANFFGAVFVELVIAYFLWSAIFQATGRVTSSASMGGYTFQSMILYYVLVSLSRRTLVAIDHGAALATDIYDGSLNRYLVYPVSLFGYKYITWMANSFVTFVQLLIALCIYLMIMGNPAEHPVTALSVAAGTFALAGATTLYYLFSMLMEMISFWAENVWSVLVMFRFAVMLLGGGMMPMTFFPAGFRQLLFWLPFEPMVALPVRAFMSNVSAHEYFMQLGVLSIWIGIVSGLVGWVWRRGSLQYSGVGV